ncbi:DUF4387 domain-containing protein [Bradyrhizobium pachyrhizi]|uniref:DUF4387 domain-containing protein n=1 Tax=Bradyrhizobium pachyrhizi TaxID=280333 RepID=UPI003D35C9AF
MPKIREICRHVRSKNAGPFWITVDFFFKDSRTFDKYSRADGLGSKLFEAMFDAPPDQVMSQPVESLKVLKVSFPRANTQGWRGERDMHGGQFYARLLDVDVG